MRKMVTGLLTVSPLTAIGVVSLLIQTKVLAVVLGPEGTGFFGLGAAFVATAGAVAALGVGSSLLKLVSEFSGAGRSDRIWPVTIVALATGTVTSLVIAVALIVSGFLFHGALVGDASLSESDRQFVILVAAASTVPLTWSAAMTGALRGFRNLKMYVVCGCITTGLVPGAIIVGALTAGARGALVGAVVGYTLSVAVFLGFAVALSRRENVPFRFPGSYDETRSLERRLLQLGVFALLAALAATVGQLAVRADLANTINLKAVGFFAAAFSLSNRLPILIYQTLGIYVSPRLSALGDRWDSIIKEQNDALRVGLLASTPIICIMIAAADLLVRLLLSAKFQPMVHLAQLMFVGELLSVIAWTLSAALFASGRAFASAADDWLFWLVFVFGAAVASRARGLTAVGIAYIAAEAVIVGAVYLYESRHHQFRWERRNVQLVAASVVATAVTALFSVVLDLAVPLGLVLAALVLVAWAAISLTPQERTRLRRLPARTRGAARADEAKV